MDEEDAENDYSFENIEMVKVESLQYATHILSLNKYKSLNKTIESIFRYFHFKSISDLFALKNFFSFLFHLI